MKFLGAGLNITWSQWSRVTDLYIMSFQTADTLNLSPHCLQMKFAKGLPWHLDYCLEKKSQQTNKNNNISDTGD